MKSNEKRRSVLKKIFMSGAALFGIGTVNASQGKPSKKVVGEIIKDQIIPNAIAFFFNEVDMDGDYEEESESEKGNILTGLQSTPFSSR